MSKIQGFKMPGTVSSMDWNYNNKFFIAGGKQAVKIVQFSPEKQYWFDCKKTVNKHKGAQMTKVCVSQLAWNKCGVDLVAIGTTSGFVFVYDVQQNSPKALLSVKGHDGNVKNILWVPQSRDQFISSSYQNQINVWDLRVKQRKTQQNSLSQNSSVQKTNVARIQYPQSIKIRDIRFNPIDKNYLAIQCSSAIKIVDFRMLKEQIVSKRIKDNELQGYMMQWDPHDKFKLSSGVSKQINILKWQANDLILQQPLCHYSLIKQYKWLSTKKNYFGISGQNPQKNICFYDLSDKDRISYMYGGHSKSIDCWMMDDKEEIILSASNAKQKNSNTANLKSSVGMIVAQYADNFINPNQSRFQHPLAFDNNSNLAFSLTINDPDAPAQYKNSRKYKYSFPTIYSQHQQQTSHKYFSTLKQQLIFLHKNYLYQGRNQTISQSNSQLALSCQKTLCSDFWKVLFVIAYPEENKQHTLQSFYEEKLNVDITFVENRIILNNRNLLKRETKKFNVNTLIQFIVDENELQTAVVACIILMNKNPELINEFIFQQIFQPYMQILRNLQLYSIASQTVLMLNKLQKFSQITTKNTTYKITCGWCKQSVTKGDCKCQLLCILCQERLNQRMVIWCKYCGHGGHAQQYKKWFSDNKYCPHGCEHQCFKEEDFY